MQTAPVGFPPASVSTILRLEGFFVLAASVGAFHLLGGNWWLFALLLLAPDLAMLGALAGDKTGARVYNLAHTYLGPALLAALSWPLAGASVLPLALIWTAHIGMDRALGYGLKYPSHDHATHLGLIGKARKAQRLANAS